MQLLILILTLLMAVYAHPQNFPIRKGVLQTDLNAGGFYITNAAGITDPSGNPITGGGGGGSTNAITNLQPNVVLTSQFAVSNEVQQLRVAPGGTGHLNLTLGGITLGGRFSDVSAQSFTGSGSQLTGIGTNNLSESFYDWLVGIESTAQAAESTAQAAEATAQAATNRMTSLPAWGLFGMAFNGGQKGWPPSGVEERGTFIYSTDGKQFVGGNGYPQFDGVSSAMRDAALVRIRDGFYGLGYTTNSATNVSFSVGIGVSSNLTHWAHVTNLSMALPGETLPATTRTWGVQFIVLGTNVVAFSSVSTNNLLSFDQRYRICPLATFPSGWGNAALLNNGTGSTNLLELQPFLHTNGVLYAIYKNEATATIHIGAFASPDPSALFTNIAEVTTFGGAVEGVNLVRLPSGKIRAYAIRYVSQAGGYGNNGQGQVLLYADADTPTSTFGASKVASVGFYAQNFKPVVIQSSMEQSAAIAAAFGTSLPRGRLNILGQKDSDLRLRGLAFTNPWPAIQIVGAETNDFAAVNFGNDVSSAGGLYAQGDGTVRVYVPTFNYNESNVVVHTYVADVVRFNSNGTALLRPVVGNLNMSAGNLFMTNAGPNGPYLSLISTGSVSTTTGTSGPLGSFMTFRHINQNGWTLGNVPGNSNRLIFMLSESPWTWIASLETNGNLVLHNGSFVGSGAFSGLTNSGPLTQAGPQTNYAHVQMQSTLGVSGSANIAGVVVSNNIVTVPSTYSITVSGTSNRAVYGIAGTTNQGFGYHDGASAIYGSGGTHIASFKTGPLQMKLAGNTDNSGAFIALSSFGPRWVEVAKQGRFAFTNVFAANTGVTNDTWGDVAAKSIGGAGAMLSDRGYYSFSNNVTLAEITSKPGFTNGSGWSGMMSNAWWVVWMSNNVVNTKQLAP